ncbi:hypothetical protein AMAG_11053 [Allomyces macrogynus ATCC 38327]|uniref:Uncharacterized protein n=1 Tax=Allomyces macrogynus (strain ATCC 38327) TaxID=578462 RepID=A0A0L0SS90_ALLM3|nr:hypothetical protein AMAG_11053 [Allomyces macrogynus ATCC 38327]|eukprot:KNE65423.1 hypothetical protein AMAG_11053 [Allomyces macrogynus ATCC 38327]
MAKQILEVTDVRITNVPQWTPTADGALLSTLSTTGVPKLPLAPANHKLANPRLWYSSAATWEKTAAAVTKSGFPATAAMCSFRFYGALRGCVPKRTEVTLPVGKDGVPLIGRAKPVDAVPVDAVPVVPPVVVVAKPAVAVEKGAGEEKNKKRKRKSDNEVEVVPNEAATVTKKVKADTDDDKEAKRRAKEAEKEAKRAEKEAKKRAKVAEKEAKRKAKDEAKAAKGK